MNQKFKVFLNETKRKLHILFPLCLVFILFCFSLVPGLKTEIVMPGLITPVENSINIKTDNQGHKLYTTAVLVVRKPSTLVSSILSVFPKNSVRRISDNENKISNIENKKMSQLDHNLSYQLALIKGYNEAGKKDSSIKLDYSFKCMKVYYAFGNESLNIGDEISKVDGELITEDNFHKFEKILNKTVYSTTSKSNIFCEKIILIPFYEINADKSNPQFTTEIQSDVGGPSGGFMQTLFIYTKLISVPQKNLKVAGTGTIEPDGTVGKIGGVIQKIYTVLKKDVDVFFIPQKNYEKHKNEILKITKNKKIKIIPIKNLTEGIVQYEKIA